MNQKTQRLTAEDVAANMRRRGVSGSVYDGPVVAWQKLALFSVIADNLVPIEKKIEF